MEIAVEVVGKLSFTSFKDDSIRRQVELGWQEKDQTVGIYTAGDAKA